MLLLFCSGRAPDASCSADIRCSWLTLRYECGTCFCVPTRMCACIYAALLFRTIASPRTVCAMFDIDGWPLGGSESIACLLCRCGRGVSAFCFSARTRRKPVIASVCFQRRNLCCFEGDTGFASIRVHVMCTPCDLGQGLCNRFSRDALTVGP